MTNHSVPWWYYYYYPYYYYYNNPYANIPVPAGYPKPGTGKTDCGDVKNQGYICNSAFNELVRKPGTLQRVSSTHQCYFSNIPVRRTTASPLHTLTTSASKAARDLGMARSRWLNAVIMGLARLPTMARSVIVLVLNPLPRTTRKTRRDLES